MIEYSYMLIYIGGNHQLPRFAADKSLGMINDDFSETVSTVIVTMYMTPPLLEFSLRRDEAALQQSLMRPQRSP